MDSLHHRVRRHHELAARRGRQDRSVIEEIEPAGAGKRAEVPGDQPELVHADATGAPKSPGRSSRARRSSKPFTIRGSSPAKKPCATSRYSLITTRDGGPSAI